MKTPVLTSAIAPFFTGLLEQYLAGDATSNMVMRYVVALFICGRSGAGKDTLRAHILEHDPRFGRVITTTTRQPEFRGGRAEMNGVDYLFVSPKTFDEMWTNGDLLERDCYAGNHYGSSVEGVLRVLASGKIPILQITFEGVDDVLPKLDYMRGRGIFISAPRGVVEARIRERARQSGKIVDEGTLALRLDEGDEEERLYKPRFTPPFGAVVVNDDLSRAQKEILAHANAMADYLEDVCALAINGLTR